MKENAIHTSIWAEISFDNLKHNYDILRKKIGDKVMLMGVVKAEAYGHGITYMGRELEALGVDYFGVANLQEAVKLRDGGVTKPILVLGMAWPEDADIVMKNDINITIDSVEAAERFSKAAVSSGGTIKTHIKIDTGMTRRGIIASGRVDAAADDVEYITKLKGICVNGMYTHFAVADSDDGEEFTEIQFERFKELCEAVEKRRIEIPVKHCANSSTVLKYPKMHLDMVRPGIVTYGAAVDKDELCGEDFRPVMSLKARIAQIKECGEGVTVSYGRTFTADRDMRIAVVTIGYADGYMRSASNRDVMLVHGKRARVLGRVCMDMTMIDVTDIPEAKAGDVVTVFGYDGDVLLSPISVAENMGTIPNELITVTSRRATRVYIKNGKEIGRILYV